MTQQRQEEPGQYTQHAPGLCCSFPFSPDSLESSPQQSQWHPDYDLSPGLQDAGWKTEKHQLEVDEWRATWLLSPEKKIL